MTEPQTRLELLWTLPRGSRGAEIGVYKGRFSAAILHRVRPACFYIVDAWDESQQTDIESTILMHGAPSALWSTLRRFQGPIVHGQVRPIVESSPEAARWVRDNELDWVYIDAAHDAESALGDLEAWYPKVKKGGLIMGHDYIAEDDPNPIEGVGVAKAVRLFRDAKGISNTLHLTDERFATFWFEKEE